MAVLNANSVFRSKRRMTMPVYDVPRNVRQALNISQAYENGIFKIESCQKNVMYDRCYLFEDINYINKNSKEQRSFLLDLMAWLNSMNVDFKISLANAYQRTEDFLSSVRSEKNMEQYPDIAEGIRQWQEDSLEEVNPNVTMLRYLTVTCRADNETSARIYLNALENTITEAFEAWGSRIYKLDARQRLMTLQSIIQPGRQRDQEYISIPGKNEKRDWRNDIMPRSIRTHTNFMVMGDTYVSVLYAARYQKTLDSDTLIRSLSYASYPSVITMDMAPVDNNVVAEKLTAAQMNNEREISGEMEQKHKAGVFAVRPSYPKEMKKKKIEKYIELLDENDEKGFFMNLLVIITAGDEDTLAERVQEMQAVGRKEGCVLETCDFRQLKAWNTALPIGGRYVDCMRFFLSSSLVAFQPFHAQDLIEPGGQMLGLNKTTKHFIIADRKKLPNPHAIIVGFPGTGKSMLIKLTELSQTLLSTDEDIIIIDPQNEFEDSCEKYGGAYFNLTPKSGVYLNGFEVSQEVFHASPTVKNEFIASQTEYAKSLCAAAMKNITVTQEHDSVIGRCTERMFQEVFGQKKLKKQPTLTWLREEIKKDLERVQNAHDERIIRPIYNCLEEYTTGSCDMLSRSSNIEINSRLVGFGLAHVPENNWEAIMVTILHYLATRMDYNIQLQKATHLIVDETQVVSKKPGSAKQLNDAVLTFRKFGGIVTMAMQNVTAALSSQLLTELFSNCSYKVFLDQGGVDAQQLAAIQEFSAKEYRALSSGRIGEGVMVWNKQILLFDARIKKDNVLYQTYNTNFHEKKEEKIRETEKANASESVPETGEASGQEDVWENYYEQVMSVAEIAAVSENDIAVLLQMTEEESWALLEEMSDKGLLERRSAFGIRQYRKAV